MAKRGKSSQGKHNKRVRQIAQRHKRDGWQVKADVSGFDRPDPIGKNGYIPDVVAKKKGAKRIVEVETHDSMVKDKDQHAAFRRSAAQQKKTASACTGPLSPSRMEEKRCPVLIRVPPLG